MMTAEVSCAMMSLRNCGAGTPYLRKQHGCSRAHALSLKLKRQTVNEGYCELLQHRAERRLLCVTVYMLAGTDFVSMMMPVVASCCP